MKDRDAKVHEGSDTNVVVWHDETHVVWTSPSGRTHILCITHEDARKLADNLDVGLQAIEPCTCDRGPGCPQCTGYVA